MIITNNGLGDLTDASTTSAFIYCARPQNIPTSSKFRSHETPLNDVRSLIWSRYTNRQYKIRQHNICKTLILSTTEGLASCTKAFQANFVPWKKLFSWPPFGRYAGFLVHMKTDNFLRPNWCIGKVDITADGQLMMHTSFIVIIADTSVTSPRFIVIIIIQHFMLRIKVSQKRVIYFWKQQHWCAPVVLFWPKYK